MLKKEQHNLFIWGIIGILGAIALLSVLLYSTDKLVLDVSNITKSAYTSEQKAYTPVSDKVDFKIVNNDAIVKPNIKRSPEKEKHTAISSTRHLEHHLQKPPVMSSSLLQRSAALPSDIKKVTAFVPKVIVVRHLLKAGKYGSPFLLKLAFHSVKLLSTKHL